MCRGAWKGQQGLPKNCFCSREWTFTPLPAETLVVWEML